MHRFGVGGLTLESASPLTGLPAACRAGPADITLKTSSGEPPSADRVAFKWPGRYGLRLAEIEDGWLISSARGSAVTVAADGSRIVAYGDPSDTTTDLPDVLARRVLPRAGLLFGMVALHAAALGKGDCAIVVTGSSGAGKSTLAAALVKNHGWDLLSDDITLVRGDRSPTVAPASTGISLWPEAQRALQIPPVQCRNLAFYDGKLRYEPNPSASPGARRISALINLDRRGEHGAPVLDLLAPADGLARAILQLIQFNPADHARGGLTLLVDRLRRAVAGIPIFRLQYPNDFMALPAVSFELESLLA